MSQAPALEVPCPRCTAGAGEACVKPDGEPAKNTHAQRTEAAARAAAAARRRAETEAPDRVAGDRWRRLFSACRLELEQKGAWTRLAAEQTEAMVRSMAQADTARETCSATPTVTGSTGQEVPNGLYAVQARLDSQALAIARSLKLTPDTRGTTAIVPEDDGDGDSGGDSPESRDELDQLDELADRRKKAARRRAG